MEILSKLCYLFKQDEITSFYLNIFFFLPVPENTYSNIDLKVSFFSLGTLELGLINML